MWPPRAVLQLSSSAASMQPPNWQPQWPPPLHQPPAPQAAFAPTLDPPPGSGRYTAAGPVGSGPSCAPPGGTRGYAPAGHPPEGPSLEGSHGHLQYDPSPPPPDPFLSRQQMPEEKPWRQQNRQQHQQQQHQQQVHITLSPQHGQQQQLVEAGFPVPPPPQPHQLRAEEPPQTWRHAAGTPGHRSPGALIEPAPVHAPGGGKAAASESGDSPA